MIQNHIGKGNTYCFEAELNSEMNWVYEEDCEYVSVLLSIPSKLSFLLLCFRVAYEQEMESATVEL
jgi:hypothetical protein